MAKYRVIGVMSGTSLDGLDLAYCEFERLGEQWTYTIGPAETIGYNDTWMTRLNELHHQPMFLLPKTDAFYGKYIGQSINTFIARHKLTPDLIASHGHTIFHNPSEGYTTQIGSGSAIYAETQIPTVYDFRSLDIALGGQGAPLVPVGDELLFPEYDACLNLGGFANISYKEGGKRIAFDISPCNIILNKVARQADLEYDDQGKIAASGRVQGELLTMLNGLAFYQKKGVKSLGREWVETEIWPVVKQFEVSIEDLLATFSVHIATQILTVIAAQSHIKTVLVTGGGAYNLHLLEQLKQDNRSAFVVPEEELVNFKEAMVFAFLGLLRNLGHTNTLKEVTGSKRDSIGGAAVGV